MKATLASLLFTIAMASAATLRDLEDEVQRIEELIPLIREADAISKLARYSAKAVRTLGVIMMP